MYFIDDLIIYHAGIFFTFQLLIFLILFYYLLKLVKKSVNKNFRVDLTFLFKFKKRNSKNPIILILLFLNEICLNLEKKTFKMSSCQTNVQHLNRPKIPIPSANLKLPARKKTIIDKRITTECIY